MKIKYLVMIFSSGYWDEYSEYIISQFLGFLNETGKDKSLPYKVVQLPHLFDTKKIANETIKQSIERDRGFKRKNIYEIISIDVKQC